ncbi:MAG: TetR/AcrR family transcriptional regulator [Anaerolineales bacterium]
MPSAKKSPKDSRPRGEVTRERLIEVACGEFVHHGFHATSMRQIAQKAGVAVGGIYNHFGSKDELFAAVLDAYHPYHAVIPALEQSQGVTKEAFIRDTVQRVWEDVHGHEGRLVPLLLIEMVEFQGRHMAAMADRLFPLLIEFVNRIDERGGPLALPAPVVLRSLMSVMVGHLLTQMILERSPLMQQMDYDWFGTTMDIFLHGVIRGSAGLPAAPG